MASFSESPVRVCVTGAAGQIGYALLPLIAKGFVFGNRPVILHLLDIPPAEGALRGVVMELEDGAYPSLHSIVATTDPAVGFKDVDVAVFVGGFPRRAGMLRKDLIGKNCGIFKAQGAALNAHASRNCKVLVVANPANTNCFILAENAPDIPRANFSCLTRLDYNRASAQVAARLKTGVKNVKNVVIWGNHSATQFPDVAHGHVVTATGKLALPAAIGDEKWAQGDFIATVQQRGKAIIEARKLSSAMSAANAIADHLRSWLVTGTAEGEFVSMGVISDGSYGIEKGLVFSYPVECAGGNYSIVRGLDMGSEFAKDKLAKTAAELNDERAFAMEFLSKM